VIPRPRAALSAWAKGAIVKVGGSHPLMISHPKAVADAILSAIRTVA
jgi:hypothetical protein